MNPEPATPAPEAILFDLDGTLIDTAPDLAGALNAVFSEYQCEALPRALIRSHISKGAAGLLALQFDDPPESAGFAARRQRFLDIYHSRIALESQLFAGMASVLDTIESGGVKWGIVTNKPAWLTAPLLKALSLEARPGCVISGDTASAPKPDPAPLLLAAELLDVSPTRCLYIGDAERDVVAAHAAGMRAVIARYGYFAVDDNPDEWQADGEIDAPEDLLDWL